MAEHGWFGTHGVGRPSKASIRIRSWEPIANQGYQTLRQHRFRNNARMENKKRHTSLETALHITLPLVTRAMGAWSGAFVFQITICPLQNLFARARNLLPRYVGSNMVWQALPKQCLT